MDTLLTQLVEKLQKAFGGRLVSVVLYGSAAGGDYNPKFSDYNVLCVLTEVGTRELGASTEIFRWWREHANPAPLLLAEHEVAASTDCFAIEFTDIQRRHQLLYGKDVISTLAIDRRFYRAQVEHDLRAKLLRLRQKAAGMLADPDLLRRLELDSLSTFCVLFRHALALAGAEAPDGKRDALRQAGSRFGFDPAPFERLLDVREGTLKPRELDPVPLLGDCLASIGKVIEAVDGLEKS